MMTLETIKQKVEADRQQEGQREAERNSIRERISVLDQKIDAAILAGEESTAEKLISEQAALKGKLELAERIGQRKTDPDRYYNDVMKAAAEKVAEMQPKADKAYAEMEKAHKTYLEKKIALAKILNEAALFRADCAAVANVGPAYANERYGAIPSVRHDHLALEVAFQDKETILQMEPEYFIMAHTANDYGEFKV